LKARGQFESPLYAAIDGRLAAMVAVVDPIKAATSAAIAAPTSWA
jgi:Au+-exporting ATPase